MTTSSDPDGTGSNDDVPYLPPARAARAAAPPHDPAAAEPNWPMPEPSASDLVAPGSSATDPTLPRPLMRGAGDSMLASAPPPGSGESTGGSDASAVADVQRRPPDEPVYGSMPTAVEGDGEASRRLRAEAQRRRRRNARVGWVMAVALFGTAVVAGWFVYRAFDDEESTAGSASAEPAAEAAGQRDVESETDGGGAPTSSPDAASQPAGEPTAGDGTVPPGQAAPPVRIADRPDFRTLLYDVRVYSGVDVDAPFRHFSATYDTVADDYHGLLADSASGETSLVSFSGEWRYEVGPDGIHRRAQRSKFSLQPEPDTTLANLLAETDVLPESARPFATLTSSGPSPGEVVDGTSGTIFVYELDADAFRAADPGAHAAWTSLWATAMPDSLDLVVPGSEQVQLREVTPLDTLQDREQIDLTGLEVEPVGDWTGVVFRVTERGIVDGAVVVSPEHDTRVVYIAAAYADDPASLTFDEDGVWVDAP